LTFDRCQIRRWLRQEDGRYYEARLHQDLWGNWVLTQVWGRHGTALGRTTHTPLDDYEHGLRMLAMIEKRRVQHGYQPETDKPSS
jgi:hypothetical protein